MQLLEARPGRAEDGHADEVVVDRGHVGLGARRPVHLDVRRPRRLLHVAAQPEAAPAGDGHVEPDEAAHRRVQAVGGDEVPGRLSVDEQVVAGVVDTGHGAGVDGDAGGGDPLGQRVVQHGAAHAASGPAGEPRRRPGTVGAAVEVADPGQLATVRVDVEGVQLGDGTGHQPLAARLVDRAGAGLAHDDGEPGAVGVQRRGEADRTAAGHHEVMHRRPPSAARWSRRHAAGWRAPRPPPGCVRRAARR